MEGRMKPIDWEESQRLLQLGFTRDIDLWLFSNVTVGEQEWRDLRAAIGNRKDAGLFKVTAGDGAVFVHGPSNTLVLDDEAARFALLARLCPARWHILGSLDGRDDEGCRTDQ